MTTTEKTLAYYNANADAFVATTADIAFSALQNAFIDRLPAHASVLDVGCGSGRDSFAFLRAGLKVTAVDGSEAMCAHASKRLEQTVLCTTFENYQPTHTFDGIWACASLLHLDWTTLIQVMQKLSNALTENGYFYASFKLGNGAGERNGRFFTDMDETRLNLLLGALPDLQIDQLFYTGDARPGREKEQWLNVFLRKTAS